MTLDIRLAKRSKHLWPHILRIAETKPFLDEHLGTPQEVKLLRKAKVLNDLLEELWRWLDDTNGKNPFPRAFAFHFIAVSLHPFADGNGRTMRLMQHLRLLLGGQRLARFVPSETAIMQNRDRYYTAIHQSRSLVSLDPILEFLSACFAISAEAVVEEGRKLLRESAGRTPSTPAKNFGPFYQSGRALDARRSEMAARCSSTHS